jgi:peptidoglycan LD-endopeptidase LytH
MTKQIKNVYTANKYYFVMMLAALTVTTTQISYAQYSGQSTSNYEWSGYSRDGRSSQIYSQINNLPTYEQELYIPVLFGVKKSNITPNFGDPRGDGTRTHEGEDIMARRGTPIVSPTDAVVTNAGNGPSSGIFISTANPGGESFVYMHLDAVADGIASGGYVKKGQIIGFVGFTGNASESAPHLHFEIRKNGATDPYPRITKEFTLQEKVLSVNNYLQIASDKNTVAKNMVALYRTDFVEASRQGISLSPYITAELQTGQTVTQSQSPSPSIDSSYFGLGAQGQQVSTLQKFLINKNVGPNARLLKDAGATGYFGNVTKSALSEYQTSVGISATGYYGPLTDAHIKGTSATATPGTTYTFTRVLSLGDSGEDVRKLQQYLNAKGYTIAASGTGSSGNETTYFGTLTKNALIKLQTEKNLQPVDGALNIATKQYIHNNR